MWTQNLDDVSAPIWQLDVIRALGHVRGCVCVFVRRRGRWLKRWITLLCFIYAATAKHSWYNADNVCLCISHREPMKGKLIVPKSKSSISSSGFLNQYHVVTFWQRPAYVHKTVGTKKNKTLPRRIFLSPSLFTEAVVCDRNSGRSQVPRKLTIFFPPTANKCEHFTLPAHWHAALPMHSAGALDSNLRTNEE